MELNITNWNDISTYLNGAPLRNVIIKGDILFGISSKGVEMPLAKRSPAYWNAEGGEAYEAVDLILRETKDQLKSEGIYAKEEKDQAILRNFKKIIQNRTQAYAD